MHRPPDTSLPTLTVRWVDSTQSFLMRNPYLDGYPYFEIFDKDFFLGHQLPHKTAIPYRYAPNRMVNSDELHACVENVLQEIAQKKKQYTFFDIIQNTDFNRRKACGLLVLKFKHYPFVLKLFIEHPQSFINPQCKGFEPVFLFYLGGGINRHLAGFTRIKNLSFIEKKIQENEYWRLHADVPRKWYWISPSCKWFDIQGQNMSGKQQLHTQIPATYGIIADEIIAERKLSFKSTDDRKLALDLCTAVDHYADPNISNFLIEKVTHKIVLIDTEHFPSIVGFKKKVSINNYFDYFGQLVSKCAKDMLFSTKKERREAYKIKSELMLT